MGKEKGFLLTGCSILGKMEVPWLQAIPLCKIQKSPFSPKHWNPNSSYPKTIVHFFCPFRVQCCCADGSLSLQLWALSPSLEHTLVGLPSPLPSHSFFPLPGLGQTSRSLQPVVLGTLSMGPWNQWLLASLGPTNIPGHWHISVLLSGQENKSNLGPIPCGAGPQSPTNLFLEGKMSCARLLMTVWAGQDKIHEQSPEFTRSHECPVPLLGRVSRKQKKAEFSWVLHFKSFLQNSIWCRSV